MSDYYYDCKVHLCFSGCDESKFQFVADLKEKMQAVADATDVIKIHSFAVAPNLYHCLWLDF